LCRKDIGEGCEIISIARGVTHRTGKQAGADGNRCMIDTPKSGKPRTVVVPPHIRADIKHHLDTFVAEDVESLLFPPIRGGCHLSDTVIRDALAPALKSVGREGVRIHDLRHFSGTQVARVGNLVETMNHLGHSTITASLRYQHVVSGRDVEIANQLSALATKPLLSVVADEPASGPAPS
jgi:integrase